MVLFVGECQHGQVGPTCIECYRLAYHDLLEDHASLCGKIEELLEKQKQADLNTQELQKEIERLTRNEKCYGCGHSRESHDYSGCIIWVHADADRKCLCKRWTAAAKRV